MAQITELSLLGLIGRKHLAFVAKEPGESWYLIALEQHDAEFKEITSTTLTPSMLVQSGTGNELESVAALTSWISGTANQILITDDGDGTVTISIPDTDVTGAELENLSDGTNADTLHDHTEASVIVTHASTTGQTADDHHAQTHAHSSHTGIGTDDHHPQLHTVASHSDTSATGPELDTLTDDSMADTLHPHSELSASDGTPNAALQLTTDGYPRLSIAGAAYWQTINDTSGWTDGMAAGSSSYDFKYGVTTPVSVMSLLTNIVMKTHGGRITSTKRIDNSDSPYLLTASDHVLFCDTDADAITVNLPAGIEGTVFEWHNCGSSGNALYVDPNGTEIVYGGAAGASATFNDGEGGTGKYNTTEGWK